GQNYSVSSTGSIDTLIDVNISIGWHGSGNFQLADGKSFSATQRYNWQERVAMCSFHLARRVAILII
ncbi:MAG: hypothetical protein HC817_15505, partial [Saprospiraceae bacterium]|nr:hypothetical protein [Saprospiraceae bacterium]